MWVVVALIVGLAVGLFALLAFFSPRSLNEEEAKKAGLQIP